MHPAEPLAFAGFGTDPHHNQHGLWSITALVVLFSIVLYGVTARSALRLLDRAMGRERT